MTTDSDQLPNVQDDYDFSRETYYDLIEKGRESLELMMEVARESEHPQAFATMSGMLKDISSINEKLMQLNRQKKDLDSKEQPKAHTALPAGDGAKTQNIFVGSTTELQRFLTGENEEVAEIIDVTPDDA